METLIDYGLVILFFVGLAAFVAVVLSEASIHRACCAHRGDCKVHTYRASEESTNTDRRYARIWTGRRCAGSLFVLTFLSERKHV